MTDINQAATTETTTVVLTRAEKYAKAIAALEKQVVTATAKLADLKLEAETSGKLESVVEGSAITARIGRAETSRNVSARVVGVQELETGARRFKILFGSGIDTDTAVIQEAQIVEVLEG